MKTMTYQQIDKMEIFSAHLATFSAEEVAAEEVLNGITNFVSMLKLAKNLPLSNRQKAKLAKAFNLYQKAHTLLEDASDLLCTVSDQLDSKVAAHSKAQDGGISYVTDREVGVTG